MHRSPALAPRGSPLHTPSFYLCSYPHFASPRTGPEREMPVIVCLYVSIAAHAQAVSAIACMANNRYIPHRGHKLIHTHPPRVRSSTSVPWHHTMLCHAPAHVQQVSPDTPCHAMFQLMFPSRMVKSPLSILAAAVYPRTTRPTKTIRLLKLNIALKLAIDYP